ncbi:MAG: DUF4139 domain-containing protein [Betaproteobacteria bacterium]|nr:DUF4139 domain-containing protein [Betaproteobacteria bacterium]
MKTTFSRFCLLALYFPFATLAAEAPISQVTLYPGSAMIERTAAVKAGDTRLEITNLPANFDLDSVEIETSPGIEPGEAAWLDSARFKPLNQTEAAMEARVQGLTERINTLQVDRKAAERELKYLDSLSSGSGQDAAQRAPANDPAKVLALIRLGSQNAERRILAIDGQTRDLERELAAAKRDLALVRPNVDSVRTLTLNLAANNAGQVKIRYLFRDAGWRPAYRAFLDSADGSVRLERAAQIAQRSGEDWNRVRLTLSTGQPRQSAEGPQPRSWELRLRQEQELARARAMPEYSQAAMRAAAPRPATMAAPDQEEPRPLFEAAIIQGEFATEYVIPGTVNLPADGRRVSVALGSVSVPVKLEARIFPRASNTAWLVAKGSLPEGVWPPGLMRLYRNGAFVGQENWNPLQHAELRLPFGQNELIQVTVKPRDDTRGKGGFIAQRSERQIADTFTITNRHPYPVEVMVLEASPVSRDQAISVERRFQPEISANDWENIPGVVVWQATLSAGEQREFSVEYQIRWPQDRTIDNLP